MKMTDNRNNENRDNKKNGFGKSDRPDRARFHSEGGADRNSGYPRRSPRPFGKREYENGGADDGDNENIVVGRNAVLELIKSGRSVEKILLKETAEDEREGFLSVIRAEALKRKIPVLTVRREKLDQLSGGLPHQGTAAIASAAEYCEIEDILAAARDKGEKPLILIADGICDPQNIGAMIRTAECAGAHGMIIQKRRGALIGAAAAKASAGAVNYLPIARVTNISAAIDKLKEAGVWIFAAEADGTDYRECDLDCPAAIVMGGEDTGVSRLVREKCDYVLSLPMWGKINSLNVSAATAILMYAAAGQQRRATRQ